MSKLRGLSLNRWGFALYVGRTLLWLRWGERVIALRRAPLTFSERHGYRQFKKLWFGWRLVEVIR